MNRNFLFAAAKQRAPIRLTDGTTATLVGVPKRSGQRARVMLEGGRLRTIPIADIEWVEGQH